MYWIFVPSFILVMPWRPTLGIFSRRQQVWGFDVPSVPLSHPSQSVNHHRLVTHGALATAWGELGAAQTHWQTWRGCNEPWWSTCGSHWSLLKNKTRKPLPKRGWARTTHICIGFCWALSTREKERKQTWEEKRDGRQAKKLLKQATKPSNICTTKRTPTTCLRPDTCKHTDTDNTYTVHLCTLACMNSKQLLLVGSTLSWDTGGILVARVLKLRYFSSRT